jgi:1-acyl-sn-glycerol-3-phosphate acyltransferase
MKIMSVDPSAAVSSLDIAAEPSRWRVVINRLFFRGMLFTCGGIAIVLYRVHKPLAWHWAKASARALARLCGVKVHMHGLEHLGAGPYIFAPNHQSHFDIAALLGFLPGINRFAAKTELFNEPILGAVLRTMGMIAIERDNPLAAIQTLQDLKMDGWSVIIFPEGTRSRDGNLLPFKKGPFVAAIYLGVPIVPVVCKGTTRVMPKGQYLSILPGDVDIIVLPPIDASKVSYDDRDRLRDLVREQIAAELAR